MKITGNIGFIRKNNVLSPLDLTGGELSFSVDRDETIQIYCLHLIGSLNIKVQLQKEGARCSLNCVYLSHQKARNNLSFEVIHNERQTSSEQIVRGILLDQASMNFLGTIRIPPNSQKCVGTQNHRAVLLSDEASVSAIPELEIYADDVQCSHGSAVGPLDENALFYLQSRGIDKKQATQILLKAFLTDLMPNEIQTVIDEWMAEYV